MSLGGPSVDFMGGAGGAVAQSFLSLHLALPLPTFTGSYTATWTGATSYQLGEAIVLTPTTPSKVMLTGAGIYMVRWVPSIRMGVNTAHTVIWTATMTGAATTGTLYQTAVETQYAYCPKTIIGHFRRLSMPRTALLALEATGPSPSATLEFKLFGRYTPTTPVPTPVMTQISLAIATIP